MKAMIFPYLLAFLHLDLALTIRDGRTWAIAARGGSYKSLFLLNSGRLSLENKGNSVLTSGSLKTPLNRYGPNYSPLN